MKKDCLLLGKRKKSTVRKKFVVCFFKFKKYEISYTMKFKKAEIYFTGIINSTKK